jgi:hypothetical protein
MGFFNLLDVIATATLIAPRTLGYKYLLSSGYFIDSGHRQHPKG